MQRMYYSWYIGTLRRWQYCSHKMLSIQLFFARNQLQYKCQCCICLENYMQPQKSQNKLVWGFGRKTSAKKTLIMKKNKKQKKLLCDMLLMCVYATFACMINVNNTFIAPVFSEFK
ncbi:hypothetical protein KIL84_015390 [Mauremys mutica]|uniref:Uncharacterized protein n=1 Tax=Mauremys mutica TaxID=74926 RepID=A0A9D3WT84_9SAUR|nr:hypothetical protein KIL84_015390 [Mauremys mutica]